ncbi:hypothetical protein ACRN9F_22360, partial [Shewanella oncorhynchi]|uniref:hypothetical protein n=1 Tax=Shewanella oncorhynchi TaxID=2726434 RepID=UPI003D7AED18
VIFIGGPVLFLMSFSDYIVAHCEADLKWMGPFHYPWRDSRNLPIRPAATPRGNVFCGYCVRLVFGVIKVLIQGFIGAVSNILMLLGF